MRVNRPNGHSLQPFFSQHADAPRLEPIFKNGPKTFAVDLADTLTDGHPLKSFEISHFLLIYLRIFRIGLNRMKFLEICSNLSGLHTSISISTSETTARNVSDLICENGLSGGGTQACIKKTARS